MENDLIVLGAGISGLTLAARARRAGWNVKVLEQADRVGGCLATARFDAGPAAGYWTELGAHTAYNSYGDVLELLDGSDAMTHLRQRVRQPWRVFDAGRLQSVYARMHWLSMLPSLPRLFSQPKAGLGLRDYYSRVLGRRTYDQLMRHAFSAVSVQPADDFPADLLFRKKPRRKDIPRSFSFERGIAEMAEGLATKLDVQFGVEVASIEAATGPFRVRTGSGEEWVAPRLALAVSAWEAARLLQACRPSLAARLSAIQPAEVESLSVVVPAAVCPLPRVAGLIPVDDAFYAMVSRDVFPDPAWRGFTFHFRPGQLDAVGQRARVAEVLGIQTTDIVAEATRLSQLPALKVGHAERLAGIDAELAGQPLALTGNYFMGIAIGDCAQRSASEFARLQTVSS